MSQHGRYFKYEIRGLKMVMIGLGLLLLYRMLALAEGNIHYSDFAVPSPPPPLSLSLFCIMFRFWLFFSLFSFFPISVVVVAVDMSENYFLSNQLKYSQPGPVVLPNNSMLFPNIAKPTALVQCKKCSQHQTNINPKYMCTNSYVGKNKGNFVQTNGQHCMNV